MNEIMKRFNEFMNEYKSKHNDNINNICLSEIRSIVFIKKKKNGTELRKRI